MAISTEPRHLRVVPTPPRQLDTLFRVFAERTAAAIYATDADGRIIFFNEAAVALWGFRPELGKTKFCGSWKLYLPDGRPLPHSECPMAIALRERRIIRNMEAVAERPDGTRAAFVPYPTPVFDDTGELIGGVNLLVDISERKQAEIVASRLAAIVESSDDAIIAKDLDGVITHWNRGAERLFGYSASEVIDKPVTLLIPADRHDEEPDILQRIRRGEKVDHYETIRRRKDGSLVEISLTISPIRDAAGNIVGASKIARDITERRKAQATDALLMNEMKHRVRNTLAIVQAISAQTLRSINQEELSVFNARLHALGNAHNALSQDWNKAGLAQIVEHTLHSFGRTEQFDINIADDIRLNAKQALSLTLALHELATNALKYGALSESAGRVNIDAEHSAHSVVLRWLESGGPPVDQPTRRGFGTRMLEDLLKPACADIDYRRTGLACRIIFEV